jgi:hypothetical protein
LRPRGPTRADEILDAWDVQLGMVSLVCRQIRFKNPRGDAWQEHATFAVSEFASDHPIARTLDVDPFVFADRSKKLSAGEVK